MFYIVEFQWNQIYWLFLLIIGLLPLTVLSWYIYYKYAGYWKSAAFRCLKSSERIEITPTSCALQCGKAPFASDVACENTAGERLKRKQTKEEVRLLCWCKTLRYSRSVILLKENLLFHSVQIIYWLKTSNTALRLQVLFNFS